MQKYRFAAGSIAAVVCLFNQSGANDSKPDFRGEISKVGKHLPKNIDAEQVGQLLAIDSDEPSDLRDIAMMELMYSSGLRLSELQGLDLGDMDLSAQEVKVQVRAVKSELCRLAPKR